MFIRNENGSLEVSLENKRSARFTNIETIETFDCIVKTIVEDEIRDNYTTYSLFSLMPKSLKSKVLFKRYWIDHNTDESFLECVFYTYEDGEWIRKNFEYNNEVGIYESQLV